jgi:hypothetical protein
MTSLTWIIVGILIISLLIALNAVRVLNHRAAVIEQRLTELEETVEQFGPLLADTRSALRKAENRNLRADDLVSAATSVTNRADAASKLAYQVATNPLVRVMAWTRGVRRGVGALKSPPPTAPRLLTPDKAKQLPPAHSRLRSRSKRR